MVSRRTGRYGRKTDEQSGKMLVLQQKVQISNLFAAVSDVQFPDVEAPEKSLKEKKLEELAERARRIEEHERRFEEDANADEFNYVDDCAFLGRESEEADPCVSATNVYEDDLKSLMEVYEPEISVETFITRLDVLHSSRPKVALNAEEYRKFKEDGKRLTKFQKDCEVVRHPDYDQRIRKIEMFDSKHQRLSRQEVQRDEEDGLIDEDYFEFNLLCSVNVYPIKKTQKDIDGVESFISAEALEEQRWRRRMGLLENVHEMICQKPTNPRIAVVEKQYEDLNQKLAETESTLRADEKVLNGLVKELGSLPGCSESRKRKLSDAANSDDTNDSWQINMNRIFTKIADGSQSSEKMNDDTPHWKRELKDLERRKLDKKRQSEDKRRDEEEEDRRKEKEKRKEEENWRKEKEEEEMRKKKEQEEWEAEERARAEREEKERQRAQKEEEERLYQEQLREKERRDAKKREEEIREIANKMNDLQNLVQVEDQQKNDDAVVNIDVSSTPTPNGPWRLIKIKTPNDWQLKRKAYLERYGFSLDDVQRSSNHEERMKELGERTAAGKKPIDVRKDDIQTTTSYKISIPEAVKKIVPANLAMVQKPTNPSLPRINPCDVFRQINDWVQVKKSAQFPLYSLHKEELSYMNVTLGSLRDLMAYPFHAADGMYWPVFFGLPSDTKNAAEAHAKALIASNSFSGKYASRLLLTSPISENNLEKQFEENYVDSEGDWAEYSQKEGRFSRRKGFKGERPKITESFEIQRNRAVQANRDAFEREVNEMKQFERYYREYQESNDEDKYNNQYTIHLQQLVKDARLDMYTLREGKAKHHPGTRDTHIDPRWHTHGYESYFKTRDKAYVSVMNRECSEYESLLPFPSDIEDFEFWALDPMLASLYYQAVYNNFQVHDTPATNALIARKAAYDKLMKQKHFSLDRAVELCRMTEADKEQWTILHDQLVSHFKVFPAVFSLMYSRKDPLHTCTQRAISVAMETWCKDHSNGWVLK